MANLRFTAVGGAVTITTAWTGAAWTGSDVEYSLNGGAWTAFTVGATSGNTSVTVPDGGYMELRGTTGVSLSKTQYSSFQFTGAGTVEASGSVQSLYGDDNTRPAMCQKMFYNQKKLTTSPEFPAVVLGEDCYCATFRDCSNLRTAPKCLPARTAAVECYCCMFDFCSSLTGVMPTIELTTVATGMMLAMFRGCTGVDRVTIATPWSALAGTLPAQCFGDQYNTWLKDCAATGVIECTADVAQHASGIAYFRPSGWTAEAHDFIAERSDLLVTYGNLKYYHEHMVAPLRDDVDGMDATALEGRVTANETNITSLTGTVSGYGSRIHDCEMEVGLLTTKVGYKTNSAVFNTIATMVSAFNSSPQDLQFGDIVRIDALGVPDMWITGSRTGNPTTYTYTTDEAFLAALSTGHVTVGYVTLAPVEALGEALTSRVAAMEPLVTSYNTEVKTPIVDRGRKIVSEPAAVSQHSYIDLTSNEPFNFVALSGTSTSYYNYNIPYTQGIPYKRYYIVNVGTSSIDLSRELIMALGQANVLGYAQSVSSWTLPAGAARTLVLAYVGSVCDRNSCNQLVNSSVRAMLVM